MKFIKKHKILVIFLILLILLVIAGVTLYKTLAPDLHKDTYGNRLDGIDQHQIKWDVVSKLKQDLTEKDFILKVDYHNKGKILNFLVDVNGSVDEATAKSIADLIASAFMEEEKGFYDIQVFITCSEVEESEIYPMIGYKHKSSAVFTWSGKAAESGGFYE